MGCDDEEGFLALLSWLSFEAWW